MKITVTQKDIDEAKRGGFSRCPIALAAKNLFKFHVEVTKTRLWVDENNVRYSKFYDLPLNAQEFVGIFDTQGEVFPFEFEI